MTDEQNPYLTMPALARVEQDARAGVFLARQALRVRAPELAATLFGKVIEPQKSESVEKCPS